MARDDYYVIVYQILSYLYQCLKKGKPVNPDMISNSNKYFNINQQYWEYIMYNLVRYEYIEGLVLLEVDGKDYPYVENLEKATITPKGIDYLCDNSFMKKAKHFLKDIKEIAPFI